ncbi:hemerythrin domain-containing protein [Nakamurella sp. YIM 132087]|uniref:Hemerythrin domain-containing protein n=2 Tax=Nakamurella alba TaxID=2665158 RepID=A0A7K1FP70_9ACTN|nr:hemerythrin domain-containing protein [Nakamurella alba]
MIVVHTAMLREFRLAPAAVRRVADGDRKQAATVERHLALLCDLLHHHHTGEDELLWPPLRERLPASVVQRLDAAEDQHAAIDAALDRVADARRDFRATATGQDGAVLAEALEQLHVLLAEHLDAEERTLLPLAAAHLTEAEWRAVGAAGAASVPKSALLLVFGMFAYEGDPAVLRDMLREAPPPARVLVPRLAPRAYRRRARQVHGTAHP